MAQGAGIQLEVGLDLAFFRNQLVGLQAVTTGTKLSFGVTFKRLDIQNELNALATNIKKRNYFLEVKTNLATEIKNAGTLAKALRGLDNAVQKNRGIANRAAGGAAGATANAGRVEALINRATKPALQALYGEMSKASIPMADVGKGTVDSLRKAILSGVPQLTSDLAQGISNGLDPKMKENGTSSAKLFVDAFKSATGIASPSKVFKALGEFSADGLEIGFLNGLKDFKTKAIGEIKQIAALMKLELASVGDVRIGPGTGAARAGTRGGRQYMNPIGPLPTGSREPWAFSQYQYQPFMAQPGQARGAGVPPMRTRQPFLPAPPVMGTTSSPGMLGQARLALPAAGETSARAMREAALALREFTARQRSDARSASVMGENRMWSRVAGQVPVGAGGPFLPPGAGGGVPPRPPSGGGGGGMGGFGRALSGINLPGTGVVREIGNEFAMATKQVLLFGTAYKALAFLTSFPAQVGQAVGALQSFNNTLKAISPTAEEAKASNQFILDIVDRYNVPLQSARDGFTKLYASMAPAGFKGDEIRDLFTGVSQAAATFGMSADKVDRVNYAFAQMASKGQVMSEELKGQLGDVLPGAMGIFAEAAGFKGPDAIEKFSKALEDGAYKGEAMRGLLKNVTVVLTKEFGPGAEGAARTFQGVINRMQNSTKLLYEAFEPVAVGFLNAVVVPLTSGIKTVADGFNAFFKGVNAQTSGGFAIAKELEKLKPAFEGIRANVTALLPTLQSFANTLLGVGKVFLQIAGNPFVGYLARVYLNVLALTSVIQLLNLRALIPLIANLTRSALALIAFSVQMLRAKQGAQLFQLMVQTAGITLRTFFATTGVGLVVAGISILIERFMSMNQALEETKNKAVGAAQAIRNLTKVEARAEEQKTVRAIKLLETLKTRKRTYEGSTDVPLSESEASLLEGMGIPVQKGLGGGRYMNPMNLEGYRQRLETINLAESRSRQQKIDFDEKNEAVTTVAPIAGVGAEGGAAKVKDKQKYVSDMAKLLQQEMQQKINKINQDASISDREREVQAAATRYDYELLINKAEYNAGINDENKKDILNRGQYLADLEKTFNAENELSRQRYEDVVTSPLRGMLDEDKKAVIELEATIGMLAEGRSELTNVESRQIQIKQALIGLDEDQIKVLQPLIDLILQTAAARDTLTKAEKRNRAFTGKMTELKNQLTLAQILDPRAERRQQIRQENSEFELTDEQVESQLALEEQVAAATKARDQLRSIASSIGDAFGTAFKGIITGSMTAQEALAGMFQSIADHFADMVAQMIAEWIKMMVLKGIEAIINPMAGLGGMGGGLSSGLSSGFSAGASSAIDTSAAGWGAAFNTPLKFANGGIASGGFRAFANGGIVTGPTLGLVGEGRYNEAVIPLPDGKSVPVDLGGAMGGQAVNNIVVNVDAKGSKVEGDAQEGKQLGRVIAAAIQQELVKQKRPGGLLG
jgi:tape measure domain-containing protein